MNSMRNQDRGPRDDGTPGDAAEGTPQLETRGGPVDRDSEFFVNQRFIDAHGVEAAERFRAAVESVSASVGTGGEPDEVRTRLTEALTAAGAPAVPDVELEKIADRIARSARSVVEVEDLHAEERAGERLVEGE